MFLNNNKKDGLKLDDEGNEVLLSSDPYEDLTKEFSRDLELFIFVPDEDECFERIFTFEHVLKEWDELKNDEALLKWLYNNKDKPIVFLPDETGTLFRSPELESENFIPVDFVNNLVSVFLSLDNRGRIKAIEAIRKLIDKWGLPACGGRELKDYISDEFNILDTAGLNDTELFKLLSRKYREKYR